MVWEYICYIEFLLSYCSRIYNALLVYMYLWLQEEREQSEYRMHKECKFERNMTRWTLVHQTDREYITFYILPLKRVFRSQSVNWSWHLYLWPAALAVFICLSVSLLSPFLSVRLSFDFVAAFCYLLCIFATYS